MFKCDLQCWASYFQNVKYFIFFKIFASLSSDKLSSSLSYFLVTSGNNQCTVIPISTFQKENAKFAVIASKVDSCTAWDFPPLLSNTIDRHCCVSCRNSRRHGAVLSTWSESIANRSKSRWLWRLNLPLAFEKDVGGIGSCLWQVTFADGIKHS